MQHSPLLKRTNLYKNIVYLRLCFKRDIAYHWWHHNSYNLRGIFVADKHKSCISFCLKKFHVICVSNLKNAKVKIWQILVVKRDLITL